MHDVSRLYMQGCSDGVFTFKGIAFHNWRGVANYICYLQGLLRLADLCADPLCGVTPRSAVSQTLNWKMSLDDDDEDDDEDDEEDDNEDENEEVDGDDDDDDGDDDDDDDADCGGDEDDEW